MKEDTEKANVKVMLPVGIITTRLVKSEDLNHHGTLFAGRTAEWFVESGFIAAASILNPQNVVCLKVHGMQFSQPAKPGEIICFESKIVFAGRTSLTAFVKVTRNKVKLPFVQGYVTFIHVDENNVPTPHLIEIRPVTIDDRHLYDEAKRLKSNE